MTGLEYARWRRGLGTEREAAKVLGCSESTIRRREGGGVITERAAEQVELAVWEVAMQMDARWEEVRARRRERREFRRWMTAGEFRQALRVLGWTQEEAERRILGAESSGVVSAMARGERVVPEWMARHLRGFLGLEVGDPWPTAVKRHEVVIRLGPERGR